MKAQRTDVIDVLTEKMKSIGDFNVAITTERERHAKFPYDYLRALDLVREQIPSEDGKKKWESDGAVIVRFIDAALRRAKNQAAEQTSRPIDKTNGQERSLDKKSA